jgi:hypothetical protein
MTTPLHQTLCTTNDTIEADRAQPKPEQFYSFYVLRSMGTNKQPSHQDHNTP